MNNDPFAEMDSAPTFQVIEAVREAVPALIALWGFSDSGKTYSALRLARGLVGGKGKIALIDTENRRAKFYAGKFGGWSHIDLQPPFTARRYIAAHNAAIESGADAVIIDSQSHVWEGEGGVLEQADANDAKGLAKWKTPKLEYKRMRNALLRSPVHVIFCLRAKEKFVQKGAGRTAEIVSLGEVPVSDARFVYEMTLAAHMESGTRKPLSPVKGPEDIAHAIKAGEFISEDSGRLIAEWLATGNAVNHVVNGHQAEARHVAADGSVAFRDWWNGTTMTKSKRDAIRPILPELQELAHEADEEIARVATLAAESNGPGNPLEDPFTGRAVA